MTGQARRTGDLWSIRRWLPAAALAILVGAAYVAGAGHYLTLGAIAENRALLKDFTADHLAGAIAIYMLVYIGVVALSLPGAAIMSVAGGFLFGWRLSVPITIAAATIGAVIVFHIVKTSFGAILIERAGPAAQKLAKGFARDSFSYLLFLRLVPVFPFFIVNAVAGLSRVNPWTFTAATAVGIIPASFAFAYLGTGLDGIIDAQAQLYKECIAQGAAGCRLELDARALWTREIVVAFIALGFIALIPIGFKRWQRWRKHS
ncbi:MAG: TVP38/TMEM64 family protein [Rhizobiales bacterium]|nr:TVP38/TMEM64 family protein [Hyphomicrobiales bacterium]